MVTWKQIGNDDRWELFINGETSGCIVAARDKPTAERILYGQPTPEPVD